MRKQIHTYIISVVILLMAGSSFLWLDDHSNAWGFYGHRKINRMAVFTLPAEMMPVYKTNIEFITAHAVDPDKRRYASKWEAVRHYIDIDHWGPTPFEDVPQNLEWAVLRFADYYLIEGEDSLKIRGVKHDSLAYGVLTEDWRNIEIDSIYQMFRRHYREHRTEDQWVFPLDSVRSGLPELFSGYSGSQLLIVDRFREFGIGPYELYGHYRKLIYAFETKNLSYILRQSADIGHYISDLHVPLHTTENYNGQFTNQIGIHAFWETRIPELFADSDYDFFVGAADYIEDVSSYIWDVTKDSHELLDSVLQIENRLRHSFPSDLQFCFEERFEKTLRTQCREFAAAYQDEMKGMVEERMRAAIKSVGNIWMSAWVEAGQPDLFELANQYQLSEEERAQEETLDKKYKKGEAKGRKHENE